MAGVDHAEDRSRIIHSLQNGTTGKSRRFPSRISLKACSNRLTASIQRHMKVGKKPPKSETPKQHEVWLHLTPVEATSRSRAGISNVLSEAITPQRPCKSLPLGLSFLVALHRATNQEEKGNRWL